MESTLEICPACSAHILFRHEADEGWCVPCDRWFRKVTRYGHTTLIGVAAHRCPSCEKRALSPRSRTGDYRCGACSKTFTKEQVGITELGPEPDAPVEEARCLKCKKKALRHRVRTDDFRCSSCGVIQEAREIDRYIADEYDERIAVLLSRFVDRVVPMEVCPSKSKEGSGIGLGCLFLLSIGLGVYVATTRFRESLGLVGAILVGVFGGFGGAVLVATAWERITGDTPSAREAAKQREKEKRASERKKWAAKNPHLAELRAAVCRLAEDDDGPAERILDWDFTYIGASDAIRALYDAVISERAEPDERALYERLRNQIVSRLPDRPGGAPYRSASKDP
jgi:DNA-directed RNA polymerase subunit RPC12/RpoP